MQDLKPISDSLVRNLRLSRPPVALCLTDTVPEGVASYEGSVPGGCVFWQEGAERSFATTTRDHELCAIGVHTHNLADPSPSYTAELGEVLGRFHDLRRQDVKEGKTPTYGESMQRLEKR